MNDNEMKLTIGFDKVVLTVSPSNKTGYGDDFVKAIKAECKCGMWATFPSSSAQSGYRAAARLVDLAWSSKSAPLLQVAPYDPSKPYLRLEFNPNRLGPAGISALKVLIGYIVHHGWSLFMNHAHASRIDVNIDAGGLPLNRVLVRSRCSRTTEVWSRKGDIESVDFGQPQTIYLGSKSASKTLYRVYALDPDKVPEGCTAATRFEAVDKKSRPLLSEIAKIKFPFENLFAYSALAAKPAGWDEGMWQMFLIIAGDHGLPVARAKLSPKLCKQADTALAATPIKSLDFSEVWKDWPALIATLGLQTPGSEKSFMSGYASEHLAA